MNIVPAEIEAQADENCSRASPVVCTQIIYFIVFFFKKKEKKRKKKQMFLMKNPGSPNPCLKKKIACARGMEEGGFRIRVFTKMLVMYSIFFSFLFCSKENLETCLNRQKLF